MKTFVAILFLLVVGGCSTTAEVVQGQGQSSTDRTAIRIVGFGMGGWVISVKGLDVDQQQQQQSVTQPEEAHGNKRASEDSDFDFARTW